MATAPPRNLGRLSEIAQVAARHGFGYLFDNRRLRRREPPDEGTPSQRGAHLRAMLDELGPTFVKFGQLLSTRPDLLPPDIIAELRALQDDVTPFSLRGGGARHPGRARAADRAALPRVRGDADGGRVDRPGAPRGAPERPPRRRQGAAPERAGARSSPTSRCSTRRRSSPRTASGGSTSSTRAGSSTSSRASIRQELDYRGEARNADTLPQGLRRPPARPRPARLLELHAGAGADARVPRRRAAGRRRPATTPELDRRRLAEIMTETWMTMVFKNGFFHGDPHPANILVLEGGQGSGSSTSASPAS